MEGRSVNKDLTNKEGQVYNAWVQMDFKQSDDNGNFKLSIITRITDMTWKLFCLSILSRN